MTKVAHIGPSLFFFSGILTYLTGNLKLIANLWKNLKNKIKSYLGQLIRIENFKMSI